MLRLFFGLAATTGVAWLWTQMIEVLRTGIMPVWMDWLAAAAAVLWIALIAGSAWAEDSVMAERAREGWKP